MIWRFFMLRRLLVHVLTIVPLLVGAQQQSFATSPPCVGFTNAPNEMSEAFGRNIPQTCITVPEDGRTRCYYTYVPDCASGATPVVFDNHATNDCPIGAELLNNWMAKADEECMIIIFPVGNAPEFDETTTFDSSLCFQVGGGLSLAPAELGEESLGCCCFVNEFPSSGIETFDLEFLREVAASVTELTPITTEGRVWVDTKRLYFAGHSNGCITSLAMAAEHSDIVAAVCCSAGVLVTPIADDYIPTPIWTIRGELDSVVPFEGFVFPGFALGFPSTLAAFNHVAELNKCNISEIETVTEAVPDMDLNDTRAFVTTIVAGSGCGSAPVELVVLNTGGHRNNNNSTEVPEAATTTLDVTSMMWEFCSAFQLEEDPDLGIATASPTPAPDTEASCPEGTFLLSGGLGCLCFSGDSLVETPSGAHVPLTTTHVGDMVKTSNGSFEPIYSFGHYSPDVIGDFVEMTTSTKNKIRLSPSHMLRVSTGAFVPASSIKVGDLLYGDSVQEVTQLARVQAKGVYAPFTPSGTIVVDGIEASCYVAFTATGDISIVGIRFSGQWLAHTFEFWHRVVCHYLGGTCSTYNADGISTWVTGPLKFFSYLITTQAPEASFVFVMGATLPFLVLFQLIEIVLFQQPLLFVTAIAAGLIAHRGRKRES